MNQLSDAAIVALIPAMVEVAKRAGLPVRFAGLAAIGIAIALYALRDFTNGSSYGAHISGWIAGGVMAGLAASGLYSQTKQIANREDSATAT